MLLLLGIVSTPQASAGKDLCIQRDSPYIHAGICYADIALCGDSNVCSPDSIREELDRATPDPGETIDAAKDLVDAVPPTLARAIEDIDA